MQHRGLLILLLFAAVASVDLVAWSILQPPPDAAVPGSAPPWPSAPAALLLALVCGQVSLLAALSGVARRPAPWPAAATAVVVLGWSILLSGPMRSVVPTWFGTAGWLVVLSVQALAVAGPLWAFRLVRWRRGAPNLATPDADARPDRPVQFTIGYLLAWMTALALVLGLYRWSFEAGGIALAEATWSDRRSWLVIALIVAGNVIVAWPAVWAMLTSTAGPWVRTIAPALAVALVAGFYLLLQTSPAHVWGSTVFYVAQTAFLIGTLGVLRIAGYRISGPHD